MNGLANNRIIRLKKLVKIIYALLTAVGIAFLLLQCLSQLGLQQGVWDNEKLLLFDHIHKLQGGDNLTQLNLARIPSLFPDYILGWLISGFTKDIRTQYMIYIWLILAMQLLMAAALLEKLVPMSFFRALILIGFLQFILIYISRAFAFNLQLAVLPLNHGGNLLLYWLFLFLLLKALSSAGNGIVYSITIGLLAFLACISNRLFYLQVILPALLVLFALKSNSKWRLFFAILIGGFSALLVSEAVLRTGCLPPAHSSFTDVIVHLQELFTLDLVSLSEWSVGGGYVILISIILAIWFSCGFQEGLIVNKKLSSWELFPLIRCYGLFVLLGGIFVLLPYPFFLRSQWGDSANLRYLMPLLLGTPISLALLFAKLTIFRISPKRQLIIAGFLSALIIFRFNISVIPLNSALVWPKNFLHWSNSYARKLEDLIPKGSAILVASNYNNLLSARALKANNNWSMQISQIASNGHADPWDQGKSEFLDSSDMQIAYNAVVLNYVDKNNILLAYGSPALEYKLDEMGNVLWLFDDGGIKRIANVLEQDLRGPFRVQCG
ncbi:hypothetical protein [Synechococcus sp. UW140]|uniref:hypothetical protein n=1 Tax=Synechococcus sp. UW140 TaxID=368503 RepID=UPI0025F9C78E|nr:hypothetical protein [Synechococcus sp. UW140]